jgi:hypothetical protein
LDPLPQVAIGQVTQDVLCLENASQVSDRLGQPVSRKAVGEALDYHMGRGGSLLEGEGDAHHLVPLLLDNTEVRRFRE